MASTICRLAKRSTARPSRLPIGKRAASAAPSEPAAAIQTLQRTAGNAAMARVLQRSSECRAREGAVKTSFDDCPANAKDIIRERTQLAKAWVDYSIRQIDAILADPSKPDPDIHALLRKHFHLGEGTHATRAIEDAMIIRGRFARISNAFAATVPFECETSCNANWRGYVTDYWIFGKGDIHVCPPFFGDGYQDQVATIIHEMTHKYLDLDDNAYVGSAAYAALSTEAAMKNADSYAEFAKEI